MTTQTAYGNVYGIETLEEAQQILAKTDAERDHEGCPECLGNLSLDACADAARAELAGFDNRRAEGNLVGDFTAREISLVARLDAWAAVQVPASDPMADTATVCGL